MKIELNLIGLVCEDIDKSLAFYRALGLPAPEESGDEDHVETTLPNGIRIAWDSLALIKQIDPEWVQAVGQRIGLAFLCESPEEVDATYARIIGQGYRSHKEPWDAFWGQRYAQVIDPDGNIIDLFAWNPR